MPANYDMGVVNDPVSVHSYVRRSKLDANMSRVLNHPELYGAWCTIVSYESQNSAASAAWSLRKRYPAAEGWSIRSKKLERSGRSHVLACYQPPGDQ